MATKHVKIEEHMVGSVERQRGSVHRVDAVLADRLVDAGHATLATKEEIALAKKTDTYREEPAVETRRG